MLFVLLISSYSLKEVEKLVQKSKTEASLRQHVDIPVDTTLRKIN